MKMKMENKMMQMENKMMMILVTVVVMHSYNTMLIMILGYDTGYLYRNDLWRCNLQAITQIYTIFFLQNNAYVIQVNCYIILST